MKEVDAYIKGLFKKYGKTQEILELKEEIKSNLDARIEDSMAEGISYEMAFAKAINDLGSIDEFIKGSKRVYINAYKREALQVAILYTVILWIITLPLRLSYSLMIINVALTLALIVLGLISLVLYRKKPEEYYKEEASIDMIRALKIRKYSWILWGFFIFVVTAFNFGVRFASNIWFSRPLTIDGPYEFLMLTISFFIPFLSIVIPIYITKLIKLSDNYEVKKL